VKLRRERRHKQLLDEFKEMRWYCKLKEEALDRTVWRTGFGRGYGAVVRQTAEWIDSFLHFDRSTMEQLLGSAMVTTELTSLTSL
jgi:S-adenosylmethionine:tRNA-ribosyltransferase-isomerase (queuine synthetase)